ncbi:MAG: hypothetical protein R3C03_09335 [Pirellulaceae bacterium]
MAKGNSTRIYLDTNGDRKLDSWSFSKTEVYRGLDTDGDENRDEIRWLGTAGTRWGLDKDQNGKIDDWKQISAEGLQQFFHSDSKSRQRSISSTSVARRRAKGP